MTDTPEKQKNEAVAQPQTGTSLVLRDGFDRKDLQHWNQNMTDSSTGHRRVAFIAFLSIFVFGGLWAAFAELGGAVIASGQIIAKDRNIIIQHLEGGIIEEINVREGETVTEDKVLARLQDTQYGPQLRANKLRRAILRTELARYRAEIAMAETVTLPASYDAEVADDPRLHEAQASQIAEFEASRRVLQSQLTISKNRENAAAGRAEGQREVLISDLKAAELFAKELEGRKQLYEQGDLAQPVYFQTQRQAAQAQAQVATRKLEIKRAEDEIISYQNQQEQIIADYLRDANTAIVQLQKELNELSQRVERMEDIVDRLEIRSPSKGTVFRIAKRSIGEVVRPGEAIFEIFPITDTYTLEVNVNVTDIEQVYNGQPVDVVFPSNRERAMVPVPGKIIYLSPTTITSEQFPMGTYIAHVEIDPDQQDQQILPGNVAQVYIKTEPQTLLEILARPITRFLYNSFKG
ncbi:HlyD family type I secretion periplasmic adaptor subunit [Kordiimonas sediminis]|uniref:Membrane fusion protein (MFP) family protein n=1 Tax=Kordiimonas sediminis TaxID=1735581 RepID=A0A919ANX3_9PROT|nr:HlyD family type I secretion periplasmic adaptor subunit [Kordiimonas sediminis]GHF18492.1 HlyD family type I secretion periplasmic adaptor subunit [Kordiimonas sediminis]